MANREWKALYDEWVYWNPELSSTERGQIVRGCIGKKAYPDFLSALGNVTRMAAEVRDPETLNLYRCDICKMTHIGNLRSGTAAILVDQQWSHFVFQEVA